MRNAETVLNVIRDRRERGLPLEDLYRQLYNGDSTCGLMAVSTQTRER